MSKSSMSGHKLKKPTSGMDYKATSKGFGTSANHRVSQYPYMVKTWSSGEPTRSGQPSKITPSASTPLRGHKRTHNI